MQLDNVGSYKFKLVESLSYIDEIVIHRIIDEILFSRKNGCTLFVAGNGGSAAIASHIATDLMFGSKLKSPPLKVVSLVDNSSMITATGNDLGFEQIFSRQLNSLGSKGDLLFLISSSGNSSNILACLDICKKIGITTIGLSGFDGGILAKRVDISLHIPTEIGCYGVVEDTHMIIGHIITELLKAQSLKEDLSE